MTEANNEFDNGAVVRRYFEALAAQDVDAALSLVDDAVVWRNTSLPTVRGVPMLRRILVGINRFRIRFSADLHELAVDGNIVLTTRTDHVALGRVRISFWVCGTFEVDGGRITLWQDYFSFENVLRGTVAGAARALLPGRR